MCFHCKDEGIEGVAFMVYVIKRSDFNNVCDAVTDIKKA